MLGTDFNFRKMRMNTKDMLFVLCFKKGGEKAKGKRHEQMTLIYARHPNEIMK